MFYSLLQGNQAGRILAWIIGILGVLANLGILLNYLKNKYAKPSFDITFIKSRNASSSKSRIIAGFLIRQLALADLLGALYLIIIASADSYYGYRYPQLYQVPNPINQTNIWLQNPLCHIARFCFYISSVLSIVITLVIACDRFVVVVFPHSRARLNLFKCRIIILLCWVLCSAYALLPTVRGIIGLPKLSTKFILRLNMCLYMDEIKSILRTFFTARLVIYYCSCCIIALLYFIIIIYVRYKRRRIATRMNQIEHRIIVTMMLITLVNAFSLLPSTILFKLPLAIRSLKDMEYIITIAMIITFCNAVINPFIYLYLSSSKRKPYKLCCFNRSKIAAKSTIQAAISDHHHKSTEIEIAPVS